MVLSDLTPVLHITGFLSATAIYGMLLAMVWRAGLSEATRLPLAAGALGLVWNVGSLAMFGLPEIGFPDPPQIFEAVAYAALGFLPAVVVHSILREHRSPSAGALVACGYLVSAAAAVGHLVNVFRSGFAPLPEAIHAIGPVFGLLVIPLLILTGGEPRWRRALWLSALAVYALSGTEIAYHSEGSLVLDLVGHHASMLLALVILYQEYRFALADRFLKGALSIIVLAGAASALLFLIGSSGASDVQALVVLLAAWVATALAYPSLRRALDRAVDRWVLRRDGFGRLRLELSEVVEAAETSSEALNRVADYLSSALGARTVRWSVAEDGEAFEGAVVALGPHGASARVAIQTAEPPGYVLTLEDLSEGRRFRLDDEGLLEWTARRVSRRIDRLRLVHERYEHELRAQEMQKLATEAELIALRAQLNPHFLFNALTTVGHLIRAAPDRAIETLLSLTHLLRSMLGTPTELSSLASELSLVKAYLEIEHARFEERLEVELDVPDSLLSVKLPPLILQPIVENAVKHGVARARLGGRVRIHGELDNGGSRLRLEVSDTGAGGSPEVFERAGRVGLANVEKRLHGYYGDRARLAVASTEGSGTTVVIELPLVRETVTTSTTPTPSTTSYGR